MTTAMQTRILSALALLGLAGTLGAASCLGLTGCSSVPASLDDRGMRDAGADAPPDDAASEDARRADRCPSCEIEQAARAEYPDIRALHGGTRGIYAGCGPNSGVCHNSRQYPNMSNLGSFLELINQPCNLLRDDPLQIHDLCEPEGDQLRLGQARYRLRYFESLRELDGDAVPRTWAAVLEKPVPAGASTDGAAVVRVEGETEIVLYDLAQLIVRVSVDAEDPQRVVLRLPEAPPGAGKDPDAFDVGAYLAEVFATAGRTADPTAIQLADPNRNGVLGYALGGRIIKPGDPANSYLLRRLADPQAGPLMPLANCCYWTRPALRALFCWVNGLRADGANAMDPIDYDACPATPPEPLVMDALNYPEPGPGCETIGLCPAQIRQPLPSEPTFTNLYDHIFVRRCAGSGCHFDDDPGGLDMSTPKLAYRSLVIEERVVPGRPEESVLWERLTRECDEEDRSCGRMPLGRAPLSDEELDLIEAWIRAGAPAN